MCGGAELPVTFGYDAPPPGETAFDLPDGTAYRREYRRCATCGHFLQVTDIDLDAALYSGAYVDATYKDRAGLERTYERIMSLPPEGSDNVQRVRRIDAWWDAHRPGVGKSVLDVGSGLGVFGARMKDLGWSCTVLDPDERTIAFSREHIGVEGICGDFMAVSPQGRWGLVTFNKVLEHVSDPVGMLRRAADFLEPDGAVYVELPDGEAATGDPDGQDREEFFVEHLHVFSAGSLALLAVRAGFRTLLLERIREPSGKYTLYAFLAAG